MTNSPAPSEQFDLSATVEDTPIVSSVEVAIGPQFLELFSEHMYSSPNKAFEELISNSWDAGADMVYVGVSEDLAAPKASVWVLDNGESMDVQGLQLLWRVANSPKPGTVLKGGRKPIGKFGIGKLSTYILAHELTYICKFTDGKIRAVMMDYRRIGQEAQSTADLHINPLRLNVHELSEENLRAILEDIDDGSKILELIQTGIPKPKDVPDWEDEFGGLLPAEVQDYKTWTLALCTSLKTAGKQISTAQLSRILRTALPLGSSITIMFNGTPLLPSKTEVPIEKEWIIGRDLAISSITYKNKDEQDVTRRVTQHLTLSPHITLEGFPGEISGAVKYYTSKISGGRSEEISASNGFLVNVLGRVINPQDPYFGLKDLNHSAWAKFRATVRADGLNDQIKVNREGFLQNDEMETFQAFLRALFNKVRTYAREQEYTLELWCNYSVS